MKEFGGMPNSVTLLPPPDELGVAASQNKAKDCASINHYKWYGRYNDKISLWHKPDKNSKRFKSSKSQQIEDIG